MKYFLLIFSIVCGISLSAQQTTPGYKQHLIVAVDGSGDYRKIQDAVDAIRAYTPEHVTVFIKNGIYREKLTIPAWVTNVSFTGESRENTIIVFGDYSGKYFNPDTLISKKKMSTFHSYTVYVHGNDISMENMTIKNDAGRVGQAVALHVDGDRFVMKNCNLLANQDTLLTANDDARQYYLNCFIEGTTDFIFGNATAVFQDCTIRSLSNSYITAASTTMHQKFGYVFFNCKMIASDECTKEYLGRPWRSYAKVVFYQCELGAHILPAGWHNWDKKENESTASYAEYKNRGAGAATDNRVPWSRQLTDQQASEYKIRNIFNGWDPDRF